MKAPDTPPAPSTGPAVGKTYAGFELTGILGEGTFALVFAAKSADYPEPVALKVSRQPVDSEATALRALREIRILGVLSNPHVVHIYDHGMGPDERWYIVMELLEGEALSQHHDFDQPMYPAEALRIVHQACLGLDEAHRAGIVHRDIKPDNLWILPDGSVKVLDFGLARAWDSTSTIGANATMGHMLIGTPHYAQPEQVSTGQLTPASDVYSMATLLYELLSGRTPLFADERCSEVRDRLDNEPLKWLVAHVKSDVVNLDRYPESAQLPPALTGLVASALAKDPAHRPASAGAMAAELAWVMHHDFGTAQAAVLHVRYPSGACRRHVLLPGVHHIGTGSKCDIRLANDAVGRVFGVLEWAGAPREAELEPLAVDGIMTVNGHVLDYRVRLPRGTVMKVAALTLELEYPDAVTG